MEKQMKAFGRKDVEDFALIALAASVSGIEGGFISTKDLVDLTILAFEGLDAREAKQ